MKTPEELARLHLAPLFEETGLSGPALNDVRASIHYIIPIELAAIPEALGDALERLIEDGELDKLFGEEITAVDDLLTLKEPGFLIEGQLAFREFDPEQFSDEGPGIYRSGGGYYGILVKAATIEAGYEKFKEECVRRVTKEIQDALKDK